ncbi:hypothetical protein OOT00_11295 [Desulfobotulus sp. H1]|uniref:Uncharacterized protein n=1 Tax=Desulfobotulus pelophilus TaxID=2823377 RepID=A0ABT3NAS2_9BACT|nr:hypothetical protein [Desulfobotulus pelophilus]MCW7754568.1 hypothetical protein [Desulfobotulus pelophilus]
MFFCAGSYSGKKGLPEREGFFFALQAGVYDASHQWMALTGAAFNPYAFVWECCLVLVGSQKLCGMVYMGFMDGGNRLDYFLNQNVISRCFLMIVIIKKM